MDETPDFAAVSGQSDQYLVPFGEHRVHADLLAPLADLAGAARMAGFGLAVASGWRSFERQLYIWNQKAAGRRAVLDDAGNPLARAAFNDEGWMWAILRWSALPGASRHHWGTEIDIYESSHVPPGYQLQLTVAETLEGGPFFSFYQWLEAHLGSDGGGFFRPYTEAHGGVAPEPWHLSYAPTAILFQNALQKTRLRSLIEASDLVLKEAVLDNLDEIFDRFVWVDWQQYPTARRGGR